MKPGDISFIKVAPKKDFVLAKAETPPKMIGSIHLSHHTKFDDKLRRVLLIAMGPEVKGLKVGDMGYVPHKLGWQLEEQYRNRIQTEKDADVYLLIKEEHIVSTFEYVTEADKDKEDVIAGLSSEKIKNLQKEKAKKMEEEGKRAAGGPGGIVHPGAFPPPQGQN